MTWKDATNRKADADAAKARREEIKKTQAELQKSYLELRGIGRPSSAYTSIIKIKS